MQESRFWLEIKPIFLTIKHPWAGACGNPQDWVSDPTWTDGQISCLFYPLACLAPSFLPSQLHPEDHHYLIVTPQLFYQSSPKWLGKKTQSSISLSLYSKVQVLPCPHSCFLVPQPALDVMRGFLSLHPAKKSFDSTKPVCFSKSFTSQVTSITISSRNLLHLCFGNCFGGVSSFTSFNCMETQFLMCFQGISSHSLSWQPVPGSPAHREEFLPKISSKLCASVEPFLFALCLFLPISKTPLTVINCSY